MPKNIWEDIKTGLEAVATILVYFLIAEGALLLSGSLVVTFCAILISVYSVNVVFFDEEEEEIEVPEGKK